MLTQDDANWIKSNRAELTEGRTETITLVRAINGGNDPYTDEPVSTEASESVVVVWKELSTVANGERDVVNGVELQNGDVQITFDSAVNLANLIRVEKTDIKYEIVTVDEKGIGAVNRLECIARRLT